MGVLFIFVLATKKEVNMDWVNVALFALNLVFFGLMIFYKNYCKKLADIATARSEAFEAENGKLDATKAAIDNVLKELEQMKVSVSLEEQRKHEFINERNKKLMNILRYSEQVNLCKQILLTAINNESLERMKELQSSLNSTILDLRSDLMHLVVFHENIGNDRSVTQFGDKIFYLATEVAVRVTNAMSLLETQQKQMKYATGLPDGREKVEWMQLALGTKKQLEAMKLDTQFKGHEGYEEAHTAYMVFLSQLYNSDVLLKYDLSIKSTL